MVSMVDATFFIIIYQIHEVSGSESMIKPSVIIVLNTLRSSVSRRSPVNEGEKVYFRSHFSISTQCIAESVTLPTEPAPLNIFEITERLSLRVSLPSRRNICLGSAAQYTNLQ